MLHIFTSIAYSNKPDFLFVAGTVTNCLHNRIFISYKKLV